jgi:tetratricopeptide (TPR) repeat protein
MSDMKSYLDKGITLNDAGNYAEAIETLGKALLCTDDKGLVSAHELCAVYLQLAFAYLRTKDYPRAIECCNQAIKNETSLFSCRKPDCETKRKNMLSAHEIRGYSYRMTSEVAKADEDYAEAKRLESERFN